MDVRHKIAAVAALIRSPAFRRGVLSCLFSAVITAGLLLLMRHFVATTVAACQEGPPSQKLVFSRTVEDPKPPPRRERVKPPRVPIEPPRPVPDDLAIGEEGVPTTFDLVVPVIGEVGQAVSEARMPIPFLTPPPDYPQHALARGVEGWVLVSFTISAAGGGRRGESFSGRCGPTGRLRCRGVAGGHALPVPPADCRRRAHRHAGRVAAHPFRT